MRAWLLPVVAFLAAAAVGAVVTPIGGDAGGGAPGPATVEGRAADPWGVPPEAGAVGERPDEYAAAPPWAMLVWRAGDGRTCFEPGQVVDRHTPGRSDELPGVKARGTLHRATLVGTLRYDSKSGIGIQLYGIGRFAPYPREIGGSCGDPDAGSGVLLAWEGRTARRDAALAVTIVGGVAGPRVRSVSAAGHGLALSRRRAFLHVVRGVREPRDVPVEVTYRDGSRRRFGA